MSDIEKPVINGKTEEPPKRTDQQMHELTTDKAQMIWDGNTMILVVPLDKVQRAFARGMLREAEDAVCVRYAEIIQRKRMIVEPSHNLRNKLAKLNPFA